MKKIKKTRGAPQKIVFTRCHRVMAKALKDVRPRDFKNEAAVHQWYAVILEVAEALAEVDGPLDADKFFRVAGMVS